MNVKTILGTLLLLCVAMPALAAEQALNPYAYFMSVSVGSNWTSPGTTQTIALQPDLVNAYLAQSALNHRVLANGEVVLGLQWSLLKSLTTQFGLAFYASSPATINGYVQVDANPVFQNYADQYNINHEHIALKSKWNVENTYHIDPYLSASLGVGFNRSYGYSMTPLIFQAVDLPLFESHSQVSFSYTVGAGIQHHVNQHISLALGYQFVSWGASHLAPAQGQSSSKGPGLNNVYSQGLEFNLSYIL